jgi:hypothetical protein
MLRQLAWDIYNLTVGAVLRAWYKRHPPGEPEPIVIELPGGDEPPSMIGGARER